MTKKNEQVHYWTETEDAWLKQARADGLTIEAIAATMGRSQSAIATRAKRLGIPKTYKKQNKLLKSGVFGSGFGGPQKAIKRPPEAFIAYGTPKDLLHIRDGECRFIIDIVGCCGAKSNGVYCDKHFRITHI